MHVNNAKDPMKVLIARGNLVHVHQIHLHAMVNSRFRDSVPFLVLRIVCEQCVGRIHG